MIKLKAKITLFSLCSVFVSCSKESENKKQQSISSVAEVKKIAPNYRSQDLSLEIEKLKLVGSYQNCKNKNDSHSWEVDFKKSTIEVVKGDKLCKLILNKIIHENKEEFIGKNYLIAEDNESIRLEFLSKTSKELNAKIKLSNYNFESDDIKLDILFLPLLSSHSVVPEKPVVPVEIFNTEQNEVDNYIEKNEIQEISYETKNIEFKYTKNKNKYTAEFSGSILLKNSSENKVSYTVEIENIDGKKISEGKLLDKGNSIELGLNELNLKTDFNDENVHNIIKIEVTTSDSNPAKRNIYKLLLSPKVEKEEIKKDDSLFKLSKSINPYGIEIKTNNNIKYLSANINPFVPLLPDLPNDGKRDLNTLCKYIEYSKADAAQYQILNDTKILSFYSDNKAIDCNKQEIFSEKFQLNDDKNYLIIIQKGKDTKYPYFIHIK